MQRSASSRSPAMKRRSLDRDMWLNLDVFRSFGQCSVGFRCKKKWIIRLDKPSTSIGSDYYLNRSMSKILAPSGSDMTEVDRVKVSYRQDCC